MYVAVYVEKHLDNALETCECHPACNTVNYVVTIPGIVGPGVAFLTEVGLTFMLMSVVLRATNTPRLRPYTGLFAGIPVALSSALTAPLLGM